jgi:hypothetical protein
MTRNRARCFPSKASTLALWLACVTNAHCVQLQDQGASAKAWGAPQRIDDTERTSDPDVAMDASGDAVVVWANFLNNGIFSSRYAAYERAWTPPEEISLPASDALDRLAVAMDASGRVVAVWAAYFTADNIWTNRSSVDGSWDRVPRRLDNSESMARWPTDSGPQLSINPAGAATAVWVQLDASEENVWAARMDPDGSWRRATLIEDSHATRAFAPEVAVDADGNAMALWAMGDGATSSIWSNHYTSGPGWGDDSERVSSSSDAGGADSPRVGVDDRGSAIAVWSQRDSGTSGIWASRYTPGGGWGPTSVRLDRAEEGNASAPDLAVLPDGRAVAVWSQSSESPSDIWANRFDGANWQGAQPIENDPQVFAEAPRVAVDAKGSAVAVWRQSDFGPFRIWASRSSSNGDWAEPEPIDAGEGGAGKPRIAVDPDGEAVAVWKMSIGTNRGVWVNRLE